VLIDYDNDNKTVWPTWTVGALFRGRGIFTSIAYIFTGIVSVRFYVDAYIDINCTEESDAV
jgi:hypothetical protein